MPDSFSLRVTLLSLLLTDKNTECGKDTPEVVLEQAATSGIHPRKLSGEENAFPRASLGEPAIASPGDGGGAQGTSIFSSADLKAVSVLALILICQQ